LADRVQRARDVGDGVEDALGALQEFVDCYPDVVADSGRPTELITRQLDALTAVSRAEVGRARLDPDQESAWLYAADACSAADLPWDEVYACWRAAEAQVLHGRRRHRLLALLRRTQSLAEELGCDPVLTELESLARTSVAWTDVSQPAAPAVVLASLPGLTNREREILGHLVSGQTYSEIAVELVISEKTVSSHVSNLLRKTGTSTRWELARLARVTAVGPAHDV